MRKCVFREEFVRDEIDRRVQDQWQETYGVVAPFGKLRQMWKTVHCSKVDPYNTGCPYSVRDCGMAFLVAVERTVGAHPDRPTGYFRSVALSMGLDRADNKPLARDTLRRTDVHKEGQSAGLEKGSGARPGSHGGLADDRGIHQAGSQGVDGEEANLRRTSHRPVSIGELLGSLDFGPHQIPSTDEQEGNE